MIRRIQRSTPVLGRITPLEDTVAWGVVAGLFAVVTAAGVLTGWTNAAMCSFILGYGAFAIYRMSNFTAWLEQECQRCASDMETAWSTNPCVCECLESAGCKSLSGG